MKQDERTPGPWTIEGPDQFGDYNIHHPADRLAVGAVVSNMRPAEEVAANAAFIVEACNSFNSLREALAEGRQAAVELASLMREGAHHKKEIKWCKVVDKIDAALKGVPQPAIPQRHGIYIASKTRHAERWRFLRDKVGEPIISTWIDEAGEGESADLDDLWRRCISEAANCEVLILYRESGDILKGGWIELGAALANGVPVFAVGIEEYSVAKHRGIRHFPDMKAAVAEARRFLRSAVDQPASEAGKLSTDTDAAN